MHWNSIRTSVSLDLCNEQRKRTLLPELLDRNRAGAFLDRRFGEANPHLSLEEKNLERFTKERQQRLKAGKGALFNLEEEDELTHYGKSLALDDSGAVPMSLGGQEDLFAQHQRRKLDEVDSDPDLDQVCPPCIQSDGYFVYAYCSRPEKSRELRSWKK